MFPKIPKLSLLKDKNFLKAETFNTLLLFLLRSLQICCLIVVANAAKHCSDECVSHNMMVCVKVNVLKIVLANVKHPK